MAGLREKQKVARKQRILEAASLLFKRDGYDKTRIEDIAELAEVSTGTTYNYYHSKADILIAVVSMEVEEILLAGTKIVDSPHASVVGALNTLIALYYEHSLVYLNKEMWRMAMAFSIQRPQTPFGKRYTDLDKRICEQVASLIQVLQLKGMVKTDIDHSVMAEIIFNNLNMMFIEFAKCDAMTIEKLKGAVARQVTPLALLITTKNPVSKK
jgi:AcrR family transcriptional regulator